MNEGTPEKDTALGCLFSILIILSICLAVWVTVEEDGGVITFLFSLIVCLFGMTMLGIVAQSVIEEKGIVLGCLFFILIILTGCWAMWVTVEEDGGIGDFVGNLTLCSFVMIVLVTFVILLVRLLHRFWQWLGLDGWWKAKIRDLRQRVEGPRGQHSERTFGIIVDVLSLIFLLICIVLFIVGLVIGLIIVLIKYGPLLLLLHLLSGIGN